jgi:hypothetical protein
MAQSGDRREAIIGRGKCFFPIGLLAIVRWMDEQRRTGLPRPDHNLDGLAGTFFADGRRRPGDPKTFLTGGLKSRVSSVYLPGKRKFFRIFGQNVLTGGKR